MIITRYSPETGISRVSRIMEDLFGNIVSESGGWSPSGDIRESDKAFTFVLDLPGVQPENVEIELIGDMLHVRGRREQSSTEESDRYVHIERAYGVFHRMFRLSDAVNRDEINATFKDGVLTITVPKASEALPKKIVISSN